MSFKKLGELTIDETPVSNSNNLITSNAVAQLSNPNLLINGDFRVNQRGQTSYTGTNKYTVDRWQLVQSNSSCLVSTNKVSISLSQQFSKFRQLVEDFEFLKGKQVTISAKISNYVHNRTYHTCLEINSGVDENIRVFLQNGIITATGVFNTNATKCELEFYNYSSGTGVDSFDVEWTKLEIGSVATPFSPRPYAEELVMCQRYFQKIPNAMFLYGHTLYDTDEQALVFVPLTTPMRPKYSIAENGSLYLYCNGQRKSISNVTFYAQYDMGFKFRANEVPTGLGVMQPVVATNMGFDIDAEIY